MPKLIVVYTVAGVVLFGALFAALALAGIGRPGIVVPKIEVAAPAPEATAPLHSPLEFVPPVFEAGRMYKTNHEIPIYDKPDVATAQHETLVAGGYFTAVYTLTEVPGPWTEITVSNGFRDYNMFLLGTDLRWKVVTPVYSDNETRREQASAFLETWHEAAAARRAERNLLEAEAAALAETPTFAEWWADRAERMGGADVANLVVAGMASALLTGVILGSIVLMTMLRREHEWSRPTTPRDDAIDLYAEDDDPFTFSKTGSAHEHHDDEDPRRA